MDHSWSKYIVYVDESGDHSLNKINPEYPVFVLAFCVFNKVYYSETVQPAFSKFKFWGFGHDMQILHEHDIRKEVNGISFKNREQKNIFMDSLSELLKESNFILIASVIEKKSLRSRYSQSENPYHLALRFCMERLSFFLEEKKEHGEKVHIIFEQRGRKEDKELELEFRRICNGENYSGSKLPFEIIFANKLSNSTGLQIADLVARPIGIKTIRPKQHNRAFDIIKPKFYSKHGRKGAGLGYEGYGLKIFPRTPK